MRTLMVLALVTASSVGSAAPKGEIVYQCNFDEFAIADNVGTNGLPKGWRVQDWADKDHMGTVPVANWGTVPAA